ncbi:hypothetical protein [Christiangramia echinicola]|nr:hypothetical protein [Christiangramia echinicola]
MDEPITAKKITKDYYLVWVYDKSDQKVLKTTNEGKSGIVQIPETVFAVGFNENYIIAKRHPNLEEKISQNLFDSINEHGDYLIKNPSDTVYLSKDDKIYQENGKWYHTSNGWNPPDSLKPYKKITFYHIIDIKSKNGSSHVFLNESDYLKKRKELGIPKELNFTIIDKELQ